MTNYKLILGASSVALGLAFATAAFADDQSSATPPAASTAPAASPPASPPPAPTPPPYPAFGFTLNNNANSPTFDAGPAGKLTVNGDFSGLAYVQNNPGFDLDGRQNKTDGVDFTNAMVTIQKTDGIVQFVLQAGGYSFPALGTSYTSGTRTTTDLFGAVPVGFVKIVPNANFSFEVGQLPTLIGAEAPFTYQNVNIERGLLWNQEPLISRGAQANFSLGPWAASVSWNDGYYSGEYSSVSGNITYTFKNSDSLVFDGSGNTSNTNFQSCNLNCFAPGLGFGGTGGPVGLAVPLGGQGNGEIFNLIFNHTVGKWAFTPYAQYSNIQGGPFNAPAQSWGLALLARYTVTPEISIGARAEYISSSGPGNVLYGPGSNAWSITITPTYQKGIFFARFEGSYVGVGSGTVGDELGPNFNETNQVRGMFETGFVF